MTQPSWAIHNEVTEQQLAIHMAKHSRQRVDTDRATEREDSEPEREIGGR